MYSTSLVSLVSALRESVVTTPSRRDSEDRPSQSSTRRRRLLRRSPSSCNVPSVRELSYRLSKDVNTLSWPTRDVRRARTLPGKQCTSDKIKLKKSQSVKLGAKELCVRALPSAVSYDRCNSLVISNVDLSIFDSKKKKSAHRQSSVYFQ